jgi:hypothetical protein
VARVKKEAKVKLFCFQKKKLHLHLQNAHRENPNLLLSSNQQNRNTA